MKSSNHKAGKIGIILAVLVILAIAIALFLFLRDKAAAPAQTISIGADQSVKLEKTGSRYADPSGFSFEKPRGYEVRSIENDGGKTILVEKVGTGTGFQILVSPYDEPAPGFTVARIKQDLPDLVMRDAKEFELSGGRGVMFDSDPDREIWFVAGDSLYQITSPLSDTEAAEHAAATFRTE